jgi:hypothetical protein
VANIGSKEFFKQYPKARVFATHGVDFTDQRGNQLVGTCPFSGKEDKFYVNDENWLWDSKSAGRSGNLPGFIKQIHEDEYVPELSATAAKALASHRKIPTHIFEQFGMGWMGNGDRYVLPVRDVNGHYVDLRMYDMNKKTMHSTAGCSVGLFGAHQFEGRANEPVYLCEGEWDTMAMTWLLKKNNAPGVVVGVPGAGTFKQEWVAMFSGKRVHVLYDNDDPGVAGELTVQKRLQGVARSLTYTHWPAELPDGFDVRDWVIYGLVQKKTPDKCFERLQFLFKKEPRQERAEAPKDGTAKIYKFKIARSKKPVPTLEDVHAVYKKWLFLSNMDAVDVVLASTLSQKLDGPPVWLFLVSPPGGGKTIALAGLTQYEQAYATSTLTPHALISGANWQGQQDPSLIPKLNGQVLVIKDFTSILGLRDTDKEEIFSILRDAYDGTCGKVFGNGVERRYESRFTIIAAVTPRIYDIGEQHASLGERFLKFVMGDNLNHESEDDIISKAIENVDQDSTIRNELADVTADFLAHSRNDAPLPTLENSLHRRIIALARFGSRLRGSVARHNYHHDVMTGRPFAEVGSRLGIQLAKMARSLALVRGHEEVGEDEYRIVRKIMLDTISQRLEDLVRIIYKSCPDEKDAIATNDLALRTRYPMETVRRIMMDMHLLDIVVKRGTGSGFKHSWNLSPYMRKAITESGLYRDPTERDRIARVVFKLRRRRAPGKA